MTTAYELIAATVILSVLVVVLAIAVAWMASPSRGRTGHLEPEPEHSYGPPGHPVEREFGLARDTVTFASGRTEEIEWNSKSARHGGRGSSPQAIEYKRVERLVYRGGGGVEPEFGATVLLQLGNVELIESEHLDTETFRWDPNED